MNRLSKTFLLAALMCIASALSAAALSTSYYSSKSKLASGKWVKIKVTEAGIHQITYDQLRQWGFSDPSKVAVYGNGGAQYNFHDFSTNHADDLKQTAALHTADGRILFYGNADTFIRIVSTGSISVTRNNSSLEGYYLLSDCEGPSAITTNAYRAATSTVYNSHLHFNYQKEEVQNVARGGALNFGPTLQPGVPQIKTFAMKDFAETGVNTNASSTLTRGYFRYEFKAKSRSSQRLTVVYPEDWEIQSRQDSSSDADSGDVIFYTDGAGYCTFEASEDNPTLDGTYNVSLALDPSAVASFAALDYCYLYYPRYNRLNDDSELDMFFPFGRTNINFKVNNAPKSVEIWNVTNLDKITRFNSSYNDPANEHECSFDGSYYSGSSTSAAHIIAFNTEKQHRAVEFAGNVKNQDIHSHQTPDYVIITTTDLYDEASRLADIHRELQGLDVSVYVQDDIFNEFSSGTPHQMGYRRMLKMFYDRNPQKLKYLLLYGAGCWDNRGIVIPKDNRLLTYPTEIASCARMEPRLYTSDSYFGMLNDSYNHATNYYEEVVLAVGRIATSNASEARGVNNKIERYMRTPPPAQIYNRALLISDDGDNNTHYKQNYSIDSLLVKENPNISITTGHNLVYPWVGRDAKQLREVITKALVNGQGYFNYTGHGGHTQITMEYAWGRSYIESTRYKYLPFAMLSTCDTYSFDRLDGGMCEKFLYNEEGGTICSVGSSRAVYLAYNQILNKAMATEYANAKPGSTYGELFRRAHNFARTTPENRNFEKAVNTMCYNFSGDPAVPVPVPRYKISIDNINGQSTEEYAELERREKSTDPIFGINVNPLIPFTVEGTILDDDGNVVTDYNGDVTIDIYDGPYMVKSQIKDGSAVTEKNPILDIVLDQEILASATTPVTNGHFTMQCTVPSPQNGGISNRLHASAASADKGSAAGSFHNLVVQVYDPEIVDPEIFESQPVITEMYLDSPDFTNGMEVGPNVTLYATVEASASGINFSTGNIGQSAILLLDNSKSYNNIATAMSTNADNTVSVELKIDALQDGPHTLTLNVNDNAGNRTSRTIDFTTINYPTVNTLSVDENVAKESATFALDHSFDDEPIARLVIEDESGATVASLNNVTFPYTWNLKGSDNNLVANGKYRAHAILHSEKLVYGTTPRAEFVVLKPID